MIRYLGLLAFVLFLFSCKKESADYNPLTASDYFPLEVGRYIEYDLDSTLFLDFGTVETVVHYKAREVVEEALFDNRQRQSYRVVRYLRKDEAQEWEPSTTIMVTPLQNTVELVENNLRYIKLASPVRPDYSWKGNKYIDTYSTELDINYLEDWDYRYDSVGFPQSFGSLSFDNTVKVFQKDETGGFDPSLPETVYADRTFAYEKYAKGVGLVRREFLHWKYQALPNTRPYYEGYGIKMTITGYGKK